MFCLCSSGSVALASARRYSFVFGNVYVVNMSTEHDFTAGSAQHDWIAQTLGAVDRDATPWLIFTGHQAM